MIVKRVDILEVDKNFEILLRLYTNEGIYTLWGSIDSKGKIYNQEGKVIARIKPDYAQALRDIARARLQSAYAISKKEVEDVLCP